MFLFVSLSLALIASSVEPSTNDLADTGLICAVDMGSNTFKFLIAEMKDGKYVQHTDIRKTVGAGDDLDNSYKKFGRRMISQEKRSEIASVLNQFQEECERKTGSRKMKALATASFREAENKLDIQDDLRDQGIEMEILSLKEESRYAYEAATFGDPGFGVVDLGSRTTEFVTKTDKDYKSAEIPTGYKVDWNAFYEAADTFEGAAGPHREKLKALIAESQFKILQDRRFLRFIEIGETAAYVLGVPQNQIEGRVITHAQIRGKLNELHAMGTHDFSELKKEFRDAAKVLPRLVLVDLILEKTGYSSFQCTDRELNVVLIFRAHS